MNSQNIFQNPKISVLLVDGSFRSRFSVIDSLKNQTFAAADFEVLWIEYFEAVRQELIDKMNGQRDFQVITLKGSGVYHSSYCFNRGITQARGELLVIADADVLVDANFLETVWKEHQTNDQLVMYVLRMDEPGRTSSLCLDLENLKKVCVLTTPENYGGCLTIRKKWLLKINGYEQHDLMRGTAHANGRDLYTRFKNFGLPVKWHPELRLYHSWHPHPPGFQDGYLLQHVLIRHRATSLDILPYNGINPALDRKIPQSLQAQLDAEKKKIQSAKYCVNEQTMSSRLLKKDPQCIKISLIICSRNRAEMLRRCLASIDQGELASVLGELILIDSDSNDGTGKIMLAYKENAPFPVKVIKAERKGLGYARKLASAAAAGEVLVFTDDDCYLEDGYLSKAATIFTDGSFHYCGGRILLFDPKDAKFALNLKEKFEFIPPHSYLRTGIIQGANFVVHKKVIDAIGSFDEKLGAGTRFRFEDIDLAARASKAGFAGAHVPELVVFHHHGRKPGPEIKELKKQNDFARGAYFTKMILLKEFKYLGEWFKLWSKHNEKGIRLREFRGALSYLIFRLQGK